MGSYVGGTTISNGVLVAGHAGAFGGGPITLEGGTLDLNGSGAVTNDLGLVGGTLANGSYDTARITNAEAGVVSAALTGTAGLTKTGAGTLTISGVASNTFSGAVTVAGGTLELAKTDGEAAISGSAVSVQDGAVLLLSASDQANDSAAVSLSGGTIIRGSGVSERFGDLALTADSFLEFGGMEEEKFLRFGGYTPDQLLSVTGFALGNQLVFGSDLGVAVNNPLYFSFDNSFVTSWEGGLFTITAIPEPSTVAAAVGLLVLLAGGAWRRRQARSGG
jgi:MYXO-CTERM domain-containing protein